MNKGNKKSGKIPQKKKVQEKAAGVKKETDPSTRFLIYFFVFLLVIFGSIIAIRFFYNPEQKVQSYSYNGFVFTNITGLWYVELQKINSSIIYNVPLHYGPSQISDVPINDNFRRFNRFSQIYITFDPTEEDLQYVALAASELSINLAQTLSITPVAACTKNATEACSERPIIDCNSSTPAIFLNPHDAASVSANKNCIEVKGAGRELIRAVDRLLLTMFGIMN